MGFKGKLESGREGNTTFRGSFPTLFRLTIEEAPDLENKIAREGKESPLAGGGILEKELKEKYLKTRKKTDLFFLPNTGYWLLIPHLHKKF